MAKRKSLSQQERAVAARLYREARQLAREGLSEMAARRRGFAREAAKRARVYEEMGE